MNKKVEGIVFDAGDVIYDATLWRRWFYKQLKKAIKLNLNYKELWFLWDEYYLRDIYLGKDTYSNIFKKFINDIKNCNYSTLGIIKMALKGKKQLENKTKPYRWAKLYLPKIKKMNIKTGILTDSERNVFEIKTRFEQWNIAEYFDIIVSSADTGIIKPYPAAYLNIIKQMKVNIKNSVFIGHDMDELIGAKNVGMMTINYFDKIQFKRFMNEIIDKK